MAALLPALIGGVVGFFAGMFLVDNGVKKLAVPLWVEFIIFVVSFLLVVIIHEAGHLVMGLATGYKFVSFRIGPFAFIREDGKLKLRIFSVMGTAGQCLLMPPETDKPEDLPYFLYHFGGGLFNIISAAVCGIAMLITGNKAADLALGTFALLSLLLGIMNLLPMGKGTANDGTNILLMKRSPSLRIAIYRQFYINGMLYKGVLPRDIPEAYFEKAEDDPKMGGHRCIPAMMCGSLAVDKKDFAKAEAEFNEALSYEGLVPLYINEITCEKIFCRIMNGASKEEIDELYDKNIRSFVKQTKGVLISKRRFLYAYNLLIAGDEKAAEKEYSEAQKLKKTYPCKGELESELELIEYIKEGRHQGS